MDLTKTGQPLLHEKSSRTVLFLVLLACLALVAFAAGDQASERFLERALNEYAHSKSNYLSDPGNSTSAWVFARSCFDWAEFASNDTQRAAIANEGIAAARVLKELDPENPAGPYYLAMNLGQLARTKSLGALKLVRQMENEFLRAISIDPKFDNAGPVRSLGMLYLEAPGWPASIGNKGKAREHLERAVQLAPHFPENHLTFMEACLKWDDRSALTKAIEKYRHLLPTARAQFAGPEWEQSWQDWADRWKEILRESTKP